MRDVFILTYDLSYPKSLRKVHNITKAFGESIQYSVFLCRLDKNRLAKLKARLSREIIEEEDQIVFMKLGAESDLNHLASAQSVSQWLYGRELPSLFRRAIDVSL